jgi:hypothetical protein
MEALVVAVETGWSMSRCGLCGQSLSSSGGTETPSATYWEHDCRAHVSYVITDATQYRIPEKVKPRRERKRDGKYGPMWGVK